MMDYTKLVIPQHRIQPKFMAWLNAALEPLLSAQKLLTSLWNQFDLDRAVGVQLDRVGTVLGVSRRLPFQPSGNVSPVMEDANYRLILRAAVAKQHFNGTIPNLYSLLQTVLGNSGLYFVPIDNQDMSVMIIVFGEVSSLVKDELERGMIIPRPEGVSMTVNVTSDKIFAWGLENEVFGGWGESIWIQTRNNF